MTPDIDNYKCAIQWLQRGLDEHTTHPSRIIQDSILHSFSVTYNLTEKLLRHAVAEYSDDPEAAFVGIREVLFRARDEGIALTSAGTWLRYGLAIEQASETLGKTTVSDFLPLMPQYVAELQSFAISLERKLAHLVQS